MKKQVLFIEFYPLHSMKIIIKELTEVIHCQPQYRRKSPEQLSGENNVFKHGHLHLFFSFKVEK